MSTSIKTNQVLQKFGHNLLVGMGCSTDPAHMIAASLLDADKHGYHTHGLGLLPMYAKMVNEGAIDASASASLEKKTNCIIRVDGANGFGQLAGRMAAEAAIDACLEQGLSLVAIRNASHLGRLGEWAELAASAGLVFMAFSNTSGGAKNVAAFGGHERKLSTNPIAFAIPTFNALPFNIIVDFATSQISGAVVHKHFRTGEPLNPEWTTTASGDPLQEAKAFVNGDGALLPLGGRITGHKGYGLALIAELLGGIAGGMVVGQSEPAWFSNAAIFKCFDPTQLMEVKDIEERINTLSDYLCDDNVRLPGQASHEKAAASEKNGVSLPAHTIDALSRLGNKLNVAVPESISDFAKQEDDYDDNQRSW